MDIWSALWILIAWCFSTRVSVSTVLNMHPCLFICLCLKVWNIMVDILQTVYTQKSLCIDKWSASLVIQRALFLLYQTSDDLGSRPEALCWYICIYIYMYVHSLYEFCYRSYIQRECHSVLAKLHPITFYREVHGSWAECHFLFSLVYQLCLALW